MRYDIYFHNDFDGRASAAVMLNFLESRGDSIVRYIPVDHGIKWAERKLTASSVRNPAIVVDFPYHPHAKFWFDHHRTAFLKKDWRKKFKQTKFHRWDQNAPSGCGLMLKSLMKHFGYKPPRHIKELAKWLDITDMGGFDSARQTLEKKEPALKLEELIDAKKDNKNLAIWLIKKLAYEPMETIVWYPKIKKTLSALKKERKNALKFYKKEIKICGKCAYINLSLLNTMDLRYAPYYLYPKIVYSLILKKGSGGALHVVLAVNPWRRSENKVHIGEFLRENYGGGGHKVVGGANFKSQKLAEHAVQKIIKHFK